MKCFKFMTPNEPCTEWQYDRTQFGNSITTEVHLKLILIFYNIYINNGSSLI